MSVALRRVRDRVRGRLRDTDARNPTYDAIEVDQAICDAYLTCSAKLPASSIYTASAFTISGGGDTFTLPTTVAQWTGNDGGAEYAGDISIQLVSTGQFLRKLTMEEMDSFRWAGPTPTTNLSIPSFFALYEGKDQTVNGICHPGARIAEVCNFFRSLMADDLRDFIGTGADDLDDVEVQFSRLAANALVLYTAADLLERMDAEDAKLRRINPGAAAGWRKDAEIMLYQEAGRRHDIEDIGRTQRRVG